MPLHDYRCPECGAVRLDVYRPISVGARGDLPHCDACARTMQWIPQVGRIDAGSGPGFKTFTAQQRQPDGSFKEITLNSVADLRRVERESEQAARNGEGEAMRFRMWSHTASNGDRNSFGDDPSVQAQQNLAALQAEAGDRRRGRLSTIRGEAARLNAEQLGPGVTESSMSVFGVD